MNAFNVPYGISSNPKFWLNPGNIFNKESESDSHKIMPIGFVMWKENNLFNETYNEEYYYHNIYLSGKMARNAMHTYVMLTAQLNIKVQHLYAVCQCG